MDGSSSDNIPTPNIISHFSVFNVQGLVPKTKLSKIPFVHDLLHDRNQLFINLTETWTGDHKDAELHIDGYAPFSSKRNHRGRPKKGRFSGGVATYVRSDYSTSFETLLEFSNGVVEALCIYSSLHNLVIINIYRQPDNPLYRSTSKQFGEALIKISNILEMLSAPTPTIVMSGDFNLPHVDWKSLRCKPGATRDEQNMFALLSSLAEEYFLTQVVDQQTHFQGNILDLIFTNDCDSVLDCHYIEPLRSLSHHSVLEITTTIASHAPKPHCSNNSLNSISSPLNLLNFNSPDIDWNSIDEELSEVDWVTELKNHDVNALLDKFLSISYEIAKKHVPLQENCSIRRDPIPKDRRKLMTRRRCINKRLLRITSPSTKAKLKSELIEIEKKLQTSYINSKDFQEHQAIKSIKKIQNIFIHMQSDFPRLRIKLDHFRMDRI